MLGQVSYKQLLTGSHDVISVQREFFLRQVTITGGVDLPTGVRYEVNRTGSQFLRES